MNTYQTVLDYAKQKGYASFYLYDEKIIKQQMTLLKETFPAYHLLYSVKANPFAPVLDALLQNGFGADAASLQEVLLSSERGLAETEILYSAPCKTLADLKEASEKATIIADSLHELDLLEKIAAESERQLTIGVRINPNFTMYSDTGLSSKFGIDEEILFADTEIFKKFPHLTCIGIHVHVCSQILDAAVLQRYYTHVCNLAEKYAALSGVRLQFINFGGGLGISYQENGTPLNLETLGKACQTLADSIKKKFPACRLILETGRFPVCTSGFYITQVIDKKGSRGTTYLLVQNTLNGFFRPSVAQMIHCYQPKDAAPTEPLFTSADAFTFSLFSNSPAKEEETVTIVGNLCTAADVMAKDIRLPKAEIGDYIIVNNAGSYAYSLTPMLFASQTAPKELFLKTNGFLLEGQA